MPRQAARPLHLRREAIALSRTPWRRARRALAASLAAWFIASLMGAAVHHCPVHDAMPVAAAATHARHHAVPAPATAGRHEHSPDHPQDHSHDHHGGCSCLGQCCAASLAAVDPPAVVMLEARTTRPARPALPDVADIAIPTARYTLPFANGPPPTLRA